MYTIHDHDSDYIYFSGSFRECLEWLDSDLFFEFFIVGPNGEIYSE